MCYIGFRLVSLFLPFLSFVSNCSSVLAIAVVLSVLCLISVGSDLVHVVLSYLSSKHPLRLNIPDFCPTTSFMHHYVFALTPSSHSVFFCLDKSFVLENV